MRLFWGGAWPLLEPGPAFSLWGHCEVAVCEVCGVEMTRGGACREDVMLVVGGEVIERGRWPGPGDCPDCAVRPGAFHHAGCDQERCPVCGGQLWFCDCDVQFEVGRRVPRRRGSW